MPGAQRGGRDREPARRRCDIDALVGVCFSLACLSRAIAQKVAEGFRSGAIRGDSAEAAARAAEQAAMRSSTQVQVAKIPIRGSCVSECAWAAKRYIGGKMQCSPGPPTWADVEHSPEVGKRKRERRAAAAQANLILPKAEIENSATIGAASSRQPQGQHLRAQARLDDERNQVQPRLGELHAEVGQRGHYGIITAAGRASCDVWDVAS